MVRVGVLAERQRARNAQASQSALRLTYLISTRPPVLIRRTAIDIGFAVVDERFVADALLRFEPASPLGLRNIGHDRVLLAGLERLAIVIAGVGKRGQRLDAEFFLGGFGHGMQLAGVIAVIDDLTRHDELVLVINDDLDVVAGNHLAPFR